MSKSHQSFEPIRHGEIFMILVHRSERKATDIAKDLGFSSYTYLPRLYRRIKPFAPRLIMEICALFNCPEEIFDTQSRTDLNNRLVSLEGRVNILEKENAHLKTETALLSARLEDCEREKNVLKAKQN